MDKNKVDAITDYITLRYANVHTQATYIRMAVNYYKLFNDVTQEHINRYLSIYKNTLQNRAGLKVIVEHAGMQHLVEIPKPRSRKGPKIYKFLSKKEIDLIIETLPEKESLMVALFFETGLRLSELIYLKKSGINLTERYLEGIGKGNKPFKEPISKKSAEKLAKYLYSLEYTREHPFTYYGLKNSGKKFWEILKKHCNEINILGVHPHRIRHSLAYFLRTEKGFDIEQIKEKLRHEDIQTTQIYTNATKEEVDLKIKKELFEED